MAEPSDPPDVVAQDPHSALCVWLADQLSPDQLATAHTLIEDMLAWATGEDGWAADSNVSTGRNTMNTTEIVRRIQAIDQARLAVKPYIGDVSIACDSADAVYIHALSVLGHDTSEIEQYSGTATAIWPALRGNKAAPKTARRVAMDAAAEKDRNERFPNGSRLGNVY